MGKLCSILDRTLDDKERSEEDEFQEILFDEVKQLTLEVIAALKLNRKRGTHNNAVTLQRARLKRQSKQDQLRMELVK
jgi:hypothetical protein